LRAALYPRPSRSPHFAIRCQRSRPQKGWGTFQPQRVPANSEIDDGVLTIRGEKKSEREEENEERRYIERSFGMFSRSFTLPSNAKDDDVKATFSDGVLKVEIGKGDEPKAKAIQIH
jgi:hypothetical protein